MSIFKKYFLTIICFILIQVSSKLIESNQRILTVTNSNGKLKNLCIFYGYPSSFNSEVNFWNIANVINDFNQYEIIVLGDGLQKSSHPDHINTQNIIQGLDSSIQVFGYVAIGNTLRHTMEQMKTSVDEWNQMEVQGIFLDQFGFDYWESSSEMRARQKQIMLYVHSKGLKTIMNAWRPQDILIRQDSNPLPLTNQDYYLWESYVFSSGTPLSYLDHIVKALIVDSGKRKFGVKTLAVSTTSAQESQYNQLDFDFMTLSALVDDLYGVGWGAKDFAAGTSQMTFRPIDQELNSIVLKGNNRYNAIDQKTVRNSQSISNKVKLFWMTKTYSI